MARVRFADEARYPHGYVQAKDTDIRKRFDRERKRIAQEMAAAKIEEDRVLAEQRIVVRQIGRKK